MTNKVYEIPDLEEEEDEEDNDDEKTNNSNLKRFNDEKTNAQSLNLFSKRMKIDHLSTNNSNEINEKDQQTEISLPSNSNSKLLNSSSLLVHSRQRGNPLLKYFRQIKWEYSDQILGGADYSMSRSSCALYLSLRYHQLNPNYIYDRLKSTKFPYELKILLVQCDVSEPSQSLKELTRLSMIYELTLLISWSDEESAKYLETYRIMEGKSAEILLDGQQYQSNDYLTKYLETITQIKSINKNDGQTLLHAFGSFDSIIKSSIEQLSVCPGLGKLKAQRLFQTFNQSFRRKSFSNKFNEKLLNSSYYDQDQDQDQDQDDYHKN